MTSTKEKRAFYKSKAWRFARKRQLSKQPLCNECERLGTLKAANHVDHIVSIEDGGDKYDPGNLQSLCVNCHSYKTATENHGFGNKKRTGKGIRKGCNTDGLPLDPAHPWHGGAVQS